MSRREKRTILRAPSISSTVDPQLGCITPYYVAGVVQVPSLVPDESGINNHLFVYPEHEAVPEALFYVLPFTQVGHGFSHHFPDVLYHELFLVEILPSEQT